MQKMNDWDIDNEKNKNKLNISLNASKHINLQSLNHRDDIMTETMQSDGTIYCTYCVLVSIPFGMALIFHAHSKWPYY